MKIAIIGGGAAGMMAAATILEHGAHHEVVIIEKNDSLGKKVMLSGGGRCNVTTGLEDTRAILNKYPRGNKFLISAFHRFSPQQVRDWFETHGVPLKCEKDNRVFPVSDNGRDIVEVFKTIFEKYHAKVLYKHIVQSITKNEAFLIRFKDSTTLEVDAVILAAGGQAYRGTGSSGDGYSLAETLGHSITELRPSLHSCISQEKWPKTIAGLSLQDVLLTAHGSKKYEFTGPIIFTHAGISGPAVFALSSMTAFETATPNSPLSITIDCTPHQTNETIITLLQEQKAAHPNKAIKNSLATLVAQSLGERACIENKIDPNITNHSLTKTELEKLGSWLKQIPLQMIGRGAGDEFVTAGGVETSQIDPKTMESKICPRLYIIGELLNVDGFTGGFNLQAAWATGRAAGEALSNQL